MTLYTRIILLTSLGMTFLRFNTAMTSRNLEINISVSKNTWTIFLYSIPLLKTLPTQKSTPLNTTTKIYEIKGRASMQTSGDVTTLHPIELTLLSPIFSSPCTHPPQHSFTNNIFSCQNILGYMQCNQNCCY